MTAPKIREAVHNRKVLAIVTLDIMVWNLLRPWFAALQDAGCEVHIACARTNYFDQLRAEGYHMHEVPLRRMVNPLFHIAPFWALYRLIRRERFDVVNTHSPVAAMVGRPAGWLGGVGKISYTVHGFYFHDDMPWWLRRSFIALEWLLGKVTDNFMFVSNEDHQTAVREGIVRGRATAVTIYNGVDLEAYPPRSFRLAEWQDLRKKLDIPVDAPVVGIVGRIVKEKGYREFAEMARLVSATRSDVCFLVVGDALPSDRDGIVAEFKSSLAATGLAGKFRFSGQTSRVADYLQVMDVFVLPSYREGFPRSILEAMSTALPVVATNIRGCRESVVHGETGLLVPPRNAVALADAVRQLVMDPDMAARMGAAGRERAVLLYDYHVVARNFVKVIETTVH